MDAALNSSGFINFETQSDIGQRLLQSIFDKFRFIALKKLDCVTSDFASTTQCYELRKGHDPSFDRIIAALAYSSCSCFSIVINEIFLWEKDTHLNYKIPKQQKKLLERKAAPKNIESTLFQNFDLRVEYLLARVIIELLTVTPNSDVPEKSLAQIEDIAFSLLLEIDKKYPLVGEKARKELAELFSELIGQLSHKCFDSCASRFLKILSLDANTANVNEIVNLIKGMGRLRLLVLLL
jgi:hypothetical protein